MGSGSFAFGLQTVGSSDAACRSYVDSETLNWPHASCRSGTTWRSVTRGTRISGLLPGSGRTSIPLAINAGILIGDSLGDGFNGQAGFNDFGTLLNWRKSDTACTPLCSSLPSAAERDACRDASTDVFQELNTSCVGVALGFMGQQLRSFPVGYFGFFPPGWGNGGDGGEDHSVPEIRSGGAFVDSRFLDDRYLHHGAASHDAADQSRCEDLNGDLAPCPERIAVTLISHPIRFDPPLPVNGSRSFDVELRHRNKQNPNGILRVQALFSLPNSPTAIVDGSSIRLDQATGADWKTDSSTLTVSDSQLSAIASIELVLRSTLEDGVTEFLDLDAIEVRDTASESVANLLPLATASFDPALRDQTHLGDYAANAIDRLGGIAFWGSSSHHLTGGLAFGSRYSDTFRRMFDGMSLAESVLANGFQVSGIVYGDPIFRTSIVSLRPQGESVNARPSAITRTHPLVERYLAGIGDVVTPQNVSTRRMALMSVLHGTSKTAQTHWELGLCPLRDLVACDSQSLWMAKASGSGAVLHRPVDWVEFLADPGVDQDVLLRLRVWNPGEESLALYDYLYYDYRAN